MQSIAASSQAAQNGVSAATNKAVPAQEASANPLPVSQLSDAKIVAISSIINLCEKATISMQQEGIANAVKAIIIICMKFVDKEALFRSVLKDVYIDWEYVKAQVGGGSLTGPNKKNLLGDVPTWLHFMQFVNFGEQKIPDRILQKQHPPLYCMHSVIAASGTAGKLNFNDACKLLILNNIEGLTSKMVIELYTSSRLNRNTHSICSGETGLKE
jgi:hypothetical protein